MLVATPASAWLVEDAGSVAPQSLELQYFYPYPTTYQHVDRGYAFEDDPLQALISDPYVMPIVVVPNVQRRAMVQPRMTFVPEMYESVESI